MLSMVVGVVLDDLGRVWVADRQQQNIRVFDPRGTHVRTIGRKGSGPGEFRSVSGLTRMPNGNLLVLDFGNSRFSVYDTAGVLVTTYPRRTTVSISPWPGRFDRQGRLYDVESAGAANESRTNAVVRLDEAFQPTDTFRLPAFQMQYFEVSRKVDQNTDVTRVNVPFTPSQIWSIDPEGYVWVAVTDRYRLERYSFDGTVDRVVERRFTPVPVTAADRRRSLEGNYDFTRKGGRIDASRIPKTKPALNSLFFDHEGRMWVKPVRPEGENPVLDVFDPSGEYLGRVLAPERMVVGPGTAVRGDRMAALTMDEDGVQSVVVFRIEKPAA
ncbi:MAG TPA: 6-bladed beta-propeller [Longimicrobiaceae bacterium]|nr:6-bladed beta-propeller [Longimicrobiaceae bacterium]